MYQYRVYIYEKDENGEYYITHNFFIGRTDKQCYIDYLKKTDEATAKDMKFLNLKYKDKKRSESSEYKSLKNWWKKKLLWNKGNYFQNIEDIKKKYNIRINAGTEVIILANPLTPLNSL